LVRLLFFSSVLTGPGCRLAGEVDEFLEGRIFFETDMDEIIRPDGIYFEVSSFLESLGHSCQMKHLINVLNCLLKRGFVIAVAMGQFDGKIS
jgi:hypothetical protein